MVQPILIPKDTTIPSMTYMTEDQLHALLPTRKATLHKGSAGRVVLYCGSVGMCGAAAFCAKAAMKGGAGLVAILARESIASILQLLVPECVLTILPEENGKLTEAALPLIRQKLAWADSAVIGCGIADDDDNLQVLSLFKEASCPVVWDATALTLLARHDELLPLKNADVITPHPGEAARLLGCDAAAITENPRSTLASLQQKCGCVALLKGARTLMTDGETTAVNIHGSPALAKGGSGDVLAGLLGAYMAHMKAEYLTIVQAAVLAHSLAGETYAALHGEYGMTQQALIDCIYSGIKEEKR